MATGKIQNHKLGDDRVLLCSTTKSSAWVDVDLRGYKTVQIVHDYIINDSQHKWGTNVIVVVDTVIVSGDAYITVGKTYSGNDVNCMYENGTTFKVSINGTNDGTLYVFGLN